MQEPEEDIIEEKAPLLGAEGERLIAFPRLRRSSVDSESDELLPEAQAPTEQEGWQAYSTLRASVYSLSTSCRRHALKPLFTCKNAAKRSLPFLALVLFWSTLLTFALFNLCSSFLLPRLIDRQVARLDWPAVQSLYASVGIDSTLPQVNASLAWTETGFDLAGHVAAVPLPAVKHASLYFPTHLSVQAWTLYALSSHAEPMPLVVVDVADLHAQRGRLADHANVELPLLRAAFPSPDALGTLLAEVYTTSRLNGSFYWQGDLHVAYGHPSLVILPHHTVQLPVWDVDLAYHLPVGDPAHLLTLLERYITLSHLSVQSTPSSLSGQVRVDATDNVTTSMATMLPASTMAVNMRYNGVHLSDVLLQRDTASAHPLRQQHLFVSGNVSVATNAQRKALAQLSSYFFSAGSALAPTIEDNRHRLCTLSPQIAKEAQFEVNAEGSPWLTRLFRRLPLTLPMPYLTGQGVKDLRLVIDEYDPMHPFQIPGKVLFANPAPLQVTVTRLQLSAFHRETEIAAIHFQVPDEEPIVLDPSTETWSRVVFADLKNKLYLWQHRHEFLVHGATLLVCGFVDVTLANTTLPHVQIITTLQAQFTNDP